MAKEKELFNVSLSAMNKKLNDLETQNKFLANTLKTILETPIEMSINKPAFVEPDYSKMTRSEEIEFKRANGLIK